MATAGELFPCLSESFLYAYTAQNLFTARDNNLLKN